jgi:SAM-dependent methyltransferase|tara:strand:- start:3527 stop:4408 length:882 start_codon:yes stop_codon:yes gene_type:complete
MKNLLKKVSKVIEKNWIVKSIAFWILFLLPQRILYYFQHNITRRSFKPILYIDSDWNYTLKKIQDYQKKDQIKLLEFGAGRNLAQNIFLALSFENLHQTVVDLNQMINPRLCFEAYRDISTILGKKCINETDNIDDFLSELRIKYFSPVDVAKYQSQNKFDICVSKDTIEHIPIKKIDSILKNIKNLLLDNGLLISCVDYSDHYAHIDKRLSNLNFLKYSNFIWNFFNPPNHYQNRIRHVDYIKILQKNNFINIDESLTNETRLDIKPSSLYKKYKETDLLVLRSQISSLNKI